MGDRSHGIPSNTSEPDVSCGQIFVYWCYNLSTREDVIIIHNFHVTSKEGFSCFCHEKYTSLRYVHEGLLWK